MGQHIPDLNVASTEGGCVQGDRVVAVFENLLPDSEELRRRMAEKVGAKGIDAYSLLFQIGRDCVGALQFLPDDEDVVHDTSRTQGEPINETAIRPETGKSGDSSFIDACRNT